jgi:hypothetical protein
MEKLSYQELQEIMGYYQQRASALELTAIENQIRLSTLNGQLHDLNAEFQKKIDYYENKQQLQQIEEPITKGQTKKLKSD